MVPNKTIKKIESIMRKNAKDAYFQYCQHLGITMLEPRSNRGALLSFIENAILRSLDEFEKYEIKNGKKGLK